ncbi:MAG: HEPN domain-containing protein [Armatimonadota bacterium]
MTDQQAGLIAKAERSIRVAEMLVGTGDTDFSVSRSYYAMFYLAEALLLGEGERFSSHGAVLSALGRRFAVTGRIPKHVHQHMHRAYEAREAGDYHIANEIADDVASTQVERAREFLALVKRMLDPDDEATSEA